MKNNKLNSNKQNKYTYTTYKKDVNMTTTISQLLSAPLSSDVHIITGWVIYNTQEPLSLFLTDDTRYERYGHATKISGVTTQRLTVTTLYNGSGTIYLYGKTGVTGVNECGMSILSFS